ncbi:CAI-1 autoinducer sensor kinase/phosphatase CqsS [Elysia marginata]|uniref:CAI-1 autoinducer sensor kinase/phosphatase CqsS n=1 Tax=Elysia marginata TaxID=1093978 RepID=A0AAV4EX51_9GAST|nr:CAI-1 autoinducer sensor kinase/phosphatase CqsS [Elysia marginata]
MAPESRRLFVWSSVKQEVSSRHVVTTDSRRSYCYSLRRSVESGGGTKAVCKVLFLTTLGYVEKNDSAVMRILKSAPVESVCPAPDQRGRHEPKNKIDRDLITTHIKKYNPAVHHYRRKHAPNRLYLPSDITITDMHADFCTSVQKISLETYRTQVDKIVATHLHENDTPEEDLEILAKTPDRIMEVDFPSPFSIASKMTGQLAPPEEAGQELNNSPDAPTFTEENAVRYTPRSAHKTD